MGFKLLMEGNCFVGGPLLFQHSNHSLANISRSKRGLSSSAQHNRHVVTTLLMRGEFPDKSSI